MQQEIIYPVASKLPSLVSKPMRALTHRDHE